MLFQWRHLRFLPTPLAICCLDYALTLLGQPGAYWQGDPSAVNEASPEVHRLLTIGVFASALGVVLWTVVVAGLLALLPRPAALFLTLAVTIGHTVCATTWIWLWPSGSYHASLWLSLMAAFGLVVTIVWEETARPAPVASGDRWKWVRWPLVALLAAVPMYAFLWPH
jgi:hypothetical protein